MEVLKGSERLPKGWTVEFYLDETWDAVHSQSADCRKVKAMSRASWDATDRTRVSVSQHIRAHYWFAALVNCDGEGSASFDVTARLTFLNPGENHFSYDDIGMLQVYGLGLLAYIAFMGHYLARLADFRRGYGGIPGPHLFLTAALVLQLLFVILTFLHLYRFSHDGVGQPWLDTIARMAEMASQLAFVSLLLLMALGWTITTKAVPQRERAFSAAALLTAVHLALVWMTRSFDRAHSDFTPHETGPGLALVGLRAGLLWAFLTAISKSTRREGSTLKRELYARIRLLGAAWLLALPLLVVVAALFAPYLRSKVVAGGALAAQSGLIFTFSELFLARGEFFRISTLSADLLPASHMS